MRHLVFLIALLLPAVTFAHPLPLELRWLDPTQGTVGDPNSGLALTQGEVYDIIIFSGDGTRPVVCDDNGVIRSAPIINAFPPHWKVVKYGDGRKHQPDCVE